MMKNLYALLISFALGSQALAVEAFLDDSEPLRMGISGFALSSQRDQIVEATENALKPIFKSGGLVVKHYSVLDLEAAVKKHEVDIVLSSAGFARRLAPSGLRPIATIISPGLEDPNQNEGSVFITAADGSIKTLPDMKGSVLSANLPWGFSGFQIAMGEIALNGYNPEKFFSEMRFSGKSEAMSTIAEDVAEGRVDVGILRLCAFEDIRETNPELASKLRIVNDQHHEAVSCRASTQLYPAHTISVTPRVSSALAREMTLRLLEMPPTDAGRAWSIASDYHHVDKLLEVLKIGPYRHLREWTLKRFMEYAWPWMMLGVFLLAGWAWHTRRTETLLKRRGAILSRMFAVESAQAQELAYLQRSRTVNQISSMVAHELRQPLASLTFYAGGIEMMLDNGIKDDDKLRRLAKGISVEADRASGIVDAVRAYAKNQNQERRPVDLVETIKEAVPLARSGSGLKAAIETKFRCESALVLGSRLEIALALVNLIKNAAEASAFRHDPKILVEIELNDEDNAATVFVCDNGKPLSDEDLLKLAKPAKSRKPNGLGLGISIVRTIAESHGGRVEFSPSKDPVYTGLRAALILPLAKH